MRIPEGHIIHRQSERVETFPLANNSIKGVKALKPDNTQESFKCNMCGNTFARDGNSVQKCPVCGSSCSLETCPSYGASNEGY